MKPPALLLALFPLAASALPPAPACPREQQVFSCATLNHKVVEVCDAGDSLRYSFGRAGRKPELVFSTPRARATTDQWAGIGRYESYTVNLPHGRVVYSVYFALDRLTPAHQVEAGVNVVENGKLLATVACDTRSLYQALEGIDLGTGGQR